MKKGMFWAGMCLALVFHDLALAEFKGQHTLDKKYATYDIKRIELQVSGSWSSPACKLEPAKVADLLAAVLDRKGYAVVIRKGKSDKTEEPADAVLKAVYKTMSVGSATFTDGSTLTDYTISGSVQLALTAAGKKVVYRATGGTWTTWKDKGREGGVRTIEVGDPAEEFCKIIDPLPSRPEKEKEDQKEGEGDKTKKDKDE